MTPVVLGAALLGVAGCFLVAPFSDPPGDATGTGAQASSGSASAGTGGAGVSASGAMSSGVGAGGASSSSAGGSSNAYRDTVLGDKPVAYLRLGETQGPTAKNEINGGPLGTYLGTFSLGAHGALASDPNTAVVLGSSAKVDLGQSFDFAGTAEFSLELFFHEDDPAVGGTLMSKLYFDMGLGLFGYKLFLWPNDVRVERWNGTGMLGYLDAPKKPASGYTHVVLASSTTAMRLFVDGQLVDSRALVVDLMPTSATFLIGGDTFAGTIDEAAVYDKALTKAQIAAHYAAAMK